MSSDLDCGELELVCGELCIRHGPLQDWPLTDDEGFEMVGGLSEVFDRGDRLVQCDGDLNGGLVFKGLGYLVYIVYRLP